MLPSDVSSQPGVVVATRQCPRLPPPLRPGARADAENPKPELWTGREHQTKDITYN